MPPCALRSNDESTRKRLLELGANLPAESERTPEWLAQHVAREIDKWVPVIKKAGVTVSQ